MKQPSEGWRRVEGRDCKDWYSAGNLELFTRQLGRYQEPFSAFLHHSEEQVGLLRYR